MKGSPRRETQLSLDGVQRIYKATLVSGGLVLSWSGIEQGIQALSGAETFKLYQFLDMYKNEINPRPYPIIEEQ